MTILDSFKIQELQNLSHIYFFEYTWSNARQIILYCPHDLEGKEVDVHELVGIIFSKKEISTEKEKRQPASKLDKLLKEVDGKIVLFEDYNRF